MKESQYLEDNEKVIADLKKLPVFEPLAKEHLKPLLKMSKLRMYKSGETIISEGDVDRWMYFLIYGEVKITKENKEITVLRRRGDVFGEMRFIDSAPRFASAIAEGETVCLSVDTDYIKHLVGHDQVTFGYVLYRIMSEILAERLRQATKELIQHKGKSNIKLWG
ncbi:MAG: cyclic nucleotide-binding domain-containing protein [Thermodesulfobacteriota bacterium]